ncbi:PadR family transcriptional regulator [Limosilactobacillus fastidiosus]|uniref:Helix-turn-helix transcriptional regulator n=1 Tax=Limosilactobacillus fastidiosus TaxID=2759855 RepID=A0A7W3TZH4_9LACO|nr:PadR family transcriptional regulator [Limosilactobacillus fastidiosus]MBB1062920.1 helix-turn-helix transcriptional regulator [Limosilactobacillus fastidiosus]MBB1086169.1 helix-turn-helix transcriptional regulator [Limosilactobacillus fastidiosus]MCD7083766.1 PadR family transcriptional regulator [Limosilactobacillus fastidiosus]MCD7085084.1 PadR family transcriptional regulator [Limosilactobacillus fastidiosus]MCD7114596.1 PadR family transcriptional regulator [Limosilactobacillus fastid
MKIQITGELLDGLVLALLNQDEYYGYALTQKVKNVIDISESTMYPVLRRLKKNGDLTTYDKPFQGRNRRYYQITTTGKQRLNEILQLWEEYKGNLDQIFYQKGEEK